MANLRTTHQPTRSSSHGASEPTSRHRVAPTSHRTSGRAPEEGEVFEFVRRTEEAVMTLGRRWARAVGEVLPVETERVGRFVDDAFDLTERLLDSQRQFVRDMVEHGVVRDVVDRTRRLVPAERRRKARGRARSVTPRMPRTRPTTRRAGTTKTATARTRPAARRAGTKAATARTRTTTRSTGETVAAGHVTPASS